MNPDPTQPGAASQSDAWLRMIAEQAPAILWTTDADLVITASLGAGVAPAGSTADTGVGKMLAECLGTTDDSHVVLVGHRRALAGESVNCEFPWQGRDYDARVDPLRDAQHAVVGCIGVALDVSEIKRAQQQLRRAQMEMQRTARLASVGILAAGIAHEINNPVGAALLSAETALAIKDDPSAGPIFDECLHNIVEAMQRCGQIVKNMLKFARFEPTEKSPHDLNDLVRRARDMTRPYADRFRVQIDVTLDESLPPVWVNPLEITQVIVNLIRNAVESKASKVRVGTAPFGDLARLWVEDDGRGLSTEEREHVFDPFYTTRQGCGGTGLGLSIVYGIVQDHHGSIALSSEHGTGTTVSIELPLTAR
jgi:signal transduction histidine kinase